MAADVAQRAGAEIEPAPPYERLIDRLALELALLVGVQVGPRGRRPQPYVPIQAGRNRIGAGRSNAALRPPESLGNAGPIGPNVHLLDVADRAGPDPLAQPPPGFGLAALVAQLRSHLMLPGGQGELAGFVDVVRERLFAVDVLAELDRHHRGRRMMIVGSADKHGIDLAVHFVEHFPIVGKSLGQRLAKGLVLVMLLDLSEATVDGALDHVADGHQVFLCGRQDMVPATPAHADAGDVELGVGRRTGEDSGRGEPFSSGRRGGKDSGPSKKRAAVETCGHSVTSIDFAESLAARWQFQGGGMF